MSRTFLTFIFLTYFNTLLNAQTAAWSGYAGNAQHTALAPATSQPLEAIRWQTPVDLNPQYSGNDLLIHYGSAAITAGNTVVIPVKTGSTDGFKLEGRSGTTGALLWTQSTDYSLPAHDWTPSYSPTIAPGNKLYYAGAGGTIYTRTNLDSAGSVTATQLSFLGAGGNASSLSNYNSNSTAFNSNLKINTPITSDASGNIYFGYTVNGTVADPVHGGNLESGFARISSTGQATYVSASSLAPTGDTTIKGVMQNCAPAVSADGSKVYFGITTATGTGFGNGYLVSLNTNNLSVAGRANLLDVKTPANRANLPEQGSASPTIGPNGDVYFGVLENSFNSSKGWMLHFNSDLSVSKTAGAFGWDNTASIVPKSMVPSYTGTSDHLILTKYNNYAGLGGDGVNKLAILDPNATQIDPRTGATVMKEVLTIAGVTPDPEYIATHPLAVREWCINTAVVDPSTHSILVNSEDGKMYRWDTITNTFTESITLTPGVGEAYTPTIVGPDGTVYAINNGTLFALGFTPVPEPMTCITISFVLGGIVVGYRRRFGKHH